MSGPVFNFNDKVYAKEAVRAVDSLYVDKRQGAIAHEPRLSQPQSSGGPPATYNFNGETHVKGRITTGVNSMVEDERSTATNDQTGENRARNSEQEVRPAVPNEPAKNGDDQDEFENR